MNLGHFALAKRQRTGCFFLLVPPPKVSKFFSFMLDSVYFWLVPPLNWLSFFPLCWDSVYFWLVPTWNWLSFFPLCWDSVYFLLVPPLYWICFFFIMLGLWFFNWNWYPPKFSKYQKMLKYFSLYFVTLRKFLIPGVPVPNL